jgi:uncharacterized membrane protein YphA (DoxX/SURF4 family)
MFEAYCRENLGPLLLRVALGAVCVARGYLKIMVSGGTAWAAGLSTFWQLVISWGEFTAGVAILAGFRSRWAAAVVMALSVGTQVWWYGWGVFDRPLPDLEGELILLLMALTLVCLGGGGLSLDARGKGARPAPARAGKKRMAG